MSGLEERMRRDLHDALRSRDRAAIRVLRTALSAIANAEAQPVPDAEPANLQLLGSIAGAADGVGSTEVMRRVLDDQEVRSILEAELHECLATADQLQARGVQGEADALRADAAVLERYIRD